MSRGEVDLDVIGIAAPVRGNRDKVVAGISVVAAASRVPDDQVGRIADLVRNAAEEIGDRLRLLAV